MNFLSNGIKFTPREGSVTTIINLIEIIDLEDVISTKKSAKGKDKSLNESNGPSDSLNFSIMANRALKV